MSLSIQDPPGGFSSQEKTVSLKKEPRLSLGITIAGGRDCRSRLPVYITSVQPVGCLHRDGTIKRGTGYIWPAVALTFNKKLSLMILSEIFSSLVYVRLFSFCDIYSMSIYFKCILIIITSG